MDLYKKLSTEEIELCAKNPVSLAVFLSQHFQTSEYDARKAIIYCCETINSLEADVGVTVIESSEFCPAAAVILQEHRYLPKRDIPIAVDMALRFGLSNPEKTLKYLAAWVNTGKHLLGDDFHIQHVSGLLFLASRNPEDPSPDYQKNLRDALQKYMPVLSNNRLNRLFDDRNKLSTTLLREMLPEVLEVQDFETISRYYIVSYALFPEYTGRLRNILRQLSIRRDKHGVDTANLGEWVQHDRLKRIYSLRRVASKPLSTDKRIRLAICISGQLRGFREAFVTWPAALNLHQVDYQIFVSTWSSIGVKSLNGVHMYRHFPESLARFLSGLWIEYGESWFISCLPNLCGLITNSATITEAEVRRTYCTENVVVHEDDLLGARVSNAERMHFKIEHAWQMAAYSNKEFDLVLRVRPDKALYTFKGGIDWNDLANQSARSTVIYSDFAPRYRLHQGMAIGDQVLLAAPEMADLVFRPFSIHNYTKREGGALGMPEQFTPHSTLGGICILSGIEVKRMPGLVFSDKYLLGSSVLTNQEIAMALEMDKHSGDKAIAEKALEVLSMNTSQK